MADYPKFVLMVQPMSRQGAIWQAILRSQQISVIWESPDVDLLESLGNLRASGLALPDLLLIDTRMQAINPYTICRWCRKNCPEVKVVLVNGAQREISRSERDWALHQGAADLLPRFQRERLVSGAVAKVRRILDLLNCSTLDSGALVTALLGSNRTYRKVQDF
jgi:CheY-like chemotaxis protein